MNNKLIPILLILGAIMIIIYYHKEKVYNPAMTRYVRSFLPSKVGSNQQTCCKNLSKAEWMRKMEEKYRRINAKINEECKKHTERNKKTLNSTKIFDEIDFYYNHGQGYKQTWMVDMNHKIGYCKNSKVGTTTWIHYFFKLFPLSKQQELRKRIELDHPSSNWTSWIRSYVQKHDHIPIHSILPENKTIVQNIPFTNLLNNFFKRMNVFTFSFVRHPFERLVSAYKNKFLRSTKVSRMYPTKNITNFAEFVNLVLEEYQEQEQCRKSYNKDCSHVDRHWNLFDARCQYCEIPYNVIGKMETFDDDVKYIILKQNLEDIIPLNTTDLHMNWKGDEYANNSTLAYFSSLSKLQIRWLYEIYREDFELFDYKIDSYL